MKIEQWEALYKKDLARWLDEYKKFMYNTKNSGYCEECPENKEMGGGGCPCGQFNCWVDCHASKE